MRAGRWFIVGMWAFGLATAFLVAGSPDLRNGIFPSFAWPIAVGLLVDVAIMQLAGRGRAEPLTMNERALGIIGAGLIHTLAVAALAP